MRTILITTDFTPEASQNIAKVLASLRDTDSAVSVCLINTYLLPRSEPSRVIELNDRLKKKSRDGLEKEKAEAQSLNTNPLITIETASHLGTLMNVVQNLLGADFETLSFSKHGGEKIHEAIKARKKQFLITA